VKRFALVAAIIGAALLAGCSTLAVKAPNGMFLSTGDYVPNVQTLGIVQAETTVFEPLFMVDINKVHQQLYDQLIQKARDAGANGLTDVNFTWHLSPFSYLSIFIASGVIDFYIEGVAIKT
jgi:hypothetical protein